MRTRGERERRKTKTGIGQRRYSKGRGYIPYKRKEEGKWEGEEGKKEPGRDQEERHRKTNHTCQNNTVRNVSNSHE